jgi:hypothetical protein
MWSSGCILGELLAHKPLLQVRYPQFPLRHPVLVVRYQYLFTYMVPIPINMHFVPIIFSSPFALQSLQPRSLSLGLLGVASPPQITVHINSRFFYFNSRQLLSIVFFISSVSLASCFSFFSNYSITLVRFAPLSLPSAHVPC